MTTYRRRKSAPPLWGFVAAPLGLFGLLYVVNLFNADFQANSRTLDRITQNTAKAELETAYAEAEQARAIARYESGVCVRSVEDELLDGQHFPTLEPGTLVCSRTGVTGTVNESRQLTDIARTGNTEVIMKWGGWQ